MAAEPKGSLESALSKINCQVAEQLALAHVTVGRYLSQIIGQASLMPRYCKTFNDDLIYLSYGAPYYKPTAGQTEDALELPIVIILDSDVQGLLDCYYPFDTGAVHAGLFGEDWRNKLSDFDRFRIRKNPERIVSALYGSNGDYLRGRVLRRTAKHEPLPLLRSFLSEDLSIRGADNRQRTIEGVSRNSIDLSRSILWIAYPDLYALDIRDLWLKCTSKFDSFAYEVDVRESPAALVTYINKEARKRFSFLHTPPGKVS
jgi:hypothetical protein